MRTWNIRPWSRRKAGSKPIVECLFDAPRHSGAAHWQCHSGSHGPARPTTTQNSTSQRLSTSRRSFGTTSLCKAQRPSTFATSCASPPFWRDLLKWYRKRIPQPKGPPHPKQDNHPPFEQSIVKPSSEDQHILALVTRGLYEGESILFPLIAGKKNALLQWLLKRDSESVKRAAASVDESRPTGTMIRCLGQEPFLLALID